MNSCAAYEWNTRKVRGSLRFPNAAVSFDHQMSGKTGAMQLPVELASQGAVILSMPELYGMPSKGKSMLDARPC